MSHTPERPGRPAGVDHFSGSVPSAAEPDPLAITRIQLRPIGSPMPLGFFTVAIDSVQVSALQWGLFPAVDRRAVALVVFPAFVVQVIVGIFAFLGRDSVAATVMMSLATTWLVDALLFYLNPPGAAQALGIFFIVFAIFAMFMLVSSLPKRALAAVLVVTVPRFLVAGIAEITGSRPVSQAAAVLGFLLAAVSLYTAFALLLEDSRGREVLPIGRSGAARDAIDGSLAMQLTHIERQAGIRRTL